MGPWHIKGTPVLDNLVDNFKKKRYKTFVLEGGSRSSKTISIIQFWILYALTNIATPKRVVICRKVGSWLKPTVMNDFFKMLKMYRIYNKFDHNKTDRVYTLWGTEFWFVGLDDEQKLHGLTTDAYWFNEAIEATQDDLDQIEQRCSGFGILDYNPTEEEHWIYETVIPRDRACFMHSTMLMNTFLPEEMRNKILSYEPTDDNFRQGTVNLRKWEIYGLGKRAKVEGLIYTNWQLIDQIPDYCKRNFQGMDFGFTNDPTAHGDISFANADKNLYLHELLHKTGMLTSNIISHLKRTNKRKELIVESADPRLVTEIRLAGFIVTPVIKGPGSVEAGIEAVQDKGVFITKSSINAIKEIKNYCWQTNKKGDFINIPEDKDNHHMDYMRYVTMMKAMGIPKNGIPLHGLPS